MCSLAPLWQTVSALYAIMEASSSLWVWWWLSVNANQTKVTSNRCKSDWLRRVEKKCLPKFGPHPQWHPQWVPHPAGFYLTQFCLDIWVNFECWKMRSSEQVGFSNRWFYLQNLSHPHAAILWSNVKILILLNMKMNSKRPKGVHSILVVTNSTQLKDQCWLYDPWASKQMWKKCPETGRHLIYECL